MYLFLKIKIAVIGVKLVANKMYVISVLIQIELKGVMVVANAMMGIGINLIQKPKNARVYNNKF